MVKAYACSPYAFLVGLATCSLFAICFFQLYNVVMLIYYMAVLQRDEMDNRRRALEAAYSLPMFEFCNRLALMTDMKLIGQTLERFTSANYTVLNLCSRRIVVPVPKIIVLSKVLLEDLPQFICQMIYLQTVSRNEKPTEWDQTLFSIVLSGVAVLYASLFTFRNAKNSGLSLKDRRYLQNKLFT